MPIQPIAVAMSAHPITDSAASELLSGGRDGRCREWQPYHKPCALVGQAFNGNGPAVPFHQVLHDRKAQAGPSQFAGTRFVHAVEAFKDARKVLRWDADPGVRDADLDELLVRDGADGDRAFLRRVLDGVVQKI